VHGELSLECVARLGLFTVVALRRAGTAHASRSGGKGTGSWGRGDARRM
jgi:hypothetical protein